MTGRPLSWTARMGLVYVILLILMSTIGLQNFGGLSGADVAPGTLDPQHPLYEDFRSYGRFLAVASLMLGAFLGLYAGMAGLRADRISVGLGILVLGALVTLIPFSLLPTLRYPEGDMAAWMLWLNTGFYGYGLTWFATNLVGRLINRS